MASKYWQKTHKYGPRIPHKVKEDIEIDKENGEHMMVGYRTKGNEECAACVQSI